MHLSKKQLIILGAIAVLFLGFLIFLGSCNKRLAVPEKPQQAEVQPAQEETPAQDDPPSIPEPVVTTRSISTSMGDISVTETTEYDEALTYSRREYPELRPKAAFRPAAWKAKPVRRRFSPSSTSPSTQPSTILTLTRTRGFPEPLAPRRVPGESGRD